LSGPATTDITVDAQRHGGHEEQARPAPGVSVANNAGARMVPAVAAAVREAAVCYGLSPDADDELEEACQELLRRIAASYLEVPEGGCFDVALRRLPGRIVVQIDDRGAP
jgi:hypothetical protein